MSKIDKLLKNEKVQWKKLECLLDYEQPTKYIVKSTEYNDDYDIPVLTAGRTFVLGYTNEEENIYEADKNNPVIIFDDFTAGNHWVDFNFKVKSSAMKILKAKEGVNLRYCYHYIKTIKVDTTEHKRLWISHYSQIKIPIPSIEIQEKIVKILDKFTNCVTELQAELQARSKQYKYYRDILLSEEYLNKLSNGLNGLENKRGVSFYTLSQIFNIRKGYTPSKSVQEYWKSEDIPWFKMEDIRENGNILNCAKTYVSNSAIRGEPFEKNSIILSTSATIGEHALITVPFLANQRFTCFSVKNKYKKEVNIKYVYYYFYLIDKWCSNNIKIGNFPSVDINTLLTQIIPIPDICIQRKVVEILDKFQALLSDTKGFIPQEIEQRQKQYEYYREKLLTFEIEGK